MAKNAGDEASVKAQEKIEKKIEQEENQDIKWCLAQPAVRRLLRMIIFDMCNYETIAFTGNNKTFFNEGIISFEFVEPKISDLIVLNFPSEEEPEPEREDDRIPS